MEILIDTNFILTCVKQKIDLFSQLDELLPEYKVVVLSRVFDELNALTSDRELNLKERDAASLALQILKKKQDKVKIEPAEWNVDLAIVNYALSHENVILASLDKEVRNRVKDKVQLLAIREKKRIVLL